MFPRSFLKVCKDRSHQREVYTVNIVLHSQAEKMNIRPVVLFISVLMFKMIVQPAEYYLSIHVKIGCDLVTINRYKNFSAATVGPLSLFRKNIIIACVDGV